MEGIVNAPQESVEMGRGWLLEQNGEFVVVPTLASVSVPRGILRDYGYKAPSRQPVWVQEEKNRAYTRRQDPLAYLRSYRPIDGQEEYYPL